jgi:hypothetical protein
MISDNQITYGFVEFRQGKSRLFCKYQLINELEKFILAGLKSKNMSL